METPFRVTVVVDVYGPETQEAAEELLRDVLELDGFSVVEIAPATSGGRQVNIPKLICIDGCLYLGNEHATDAVFFDHNPHILLLIYPAGDCDRISWPNTGHPNWHAMLARVLFDERETGALRSIVDQVMLPDGSMFVIDDHINDPLDLCTES